MSGKILRSVTEFSSFYRNIVILKIVDIGVLSHTFHCKFCQDIVIPGTSSYWVSTVVSNPGLDFFRRFLKFSIDATIVVLLVPNQS